MFNWFKNLFSLSTNEVKQQTLVLNEVVPVEVTSEEAPKKTAPKKKAAKKETLVDLDSMNKTQLLAEAKKRGIKANASLKKEELLERIKNG